MITEQESKRMNGQYFTVSNPFILKPFIDWLKAIPKEMFNKPILEPFAGSNNIPAMLNSANIILTDWASYDIAPSKINNFESSPIKKRDCLAKFPKHYNIVITNPPYLGKNSATRRGLAFPETDYDDLYKVCLEQMLQNSKYVAAIIPETFITSGLFHDRLACVISLTCTMFDDTECPVCLALFNKDQSDDFKLYRMEEYLGTFNELIKYKPKPFLKHSWKINDPEGAIGIICVDNTKTNSIHFCAGEEIDKARIKNTSRSATRITGNLGKINLQDFIDECNNILNKYRIETNDIFLSSFKNLRADGKYRRRLDFATAKIIMSKALENLSGTTLPMIDFSIY